MFIIIILLSFKISCRVFSNPPLNPPHPHPATLSPPAIVLFPIFSRTFFEIEVHVFQHGWLVRDNDGESCKISRGTHQTSRCPEEKRNLLRCDCCSKGQRIQSSQSCASCSKPVFPFTLGKQHGRKQWTTNRNQAWRGYCFCLRRRAAVYLHWKCFCDRRKLPQVDCHGWLSSFTGVKNIGLSFHARRVDGSKLCFHLLFCWKVSVWTA